MSTSIEPGTNPVSPKVAIASLLMLLVPALSSVLLYLQTDQGAALYAALPVWLIVVVRSTLAGFSSFFAGYFTNDSQRILDLATSPKVIATVVVGILAQAVVDLIAFLTGDGATLYASWHPVFVVAFSAVLPAISALVAGLATKDPARLTPKNPNPVAKIPSGPTSTANQQPNLGLPDGLTPRPITHRAGDQAID